VSARVCVCVRACVCVCVCVFMLRVQGNPLGFGLRLPGRQGARLRPCCATRACACRAYVFGVGVGVLCCVRQARVAPLVWARCRSLQAYRISSD
jgi:hypothetical protein